MASATAPGTACDHATRAWVTQDRCNPRHRTIRAWCPESHLHPNPGGFGTGSLLVAQQSGRSPQPDECSSPGKDSLACACRRPARYDERTKGPDITPRYPIAFAVSASSTNSSGRTQRSTGW